MTTWKAPEMALSDACFEFTETIISAAQELLAAVDWCADLALNYGEEIGALRNACLDVQKTPWEMEAAGKLIRLATSVMRYHDTPPGSPAESTRREDMKKLIDLLRPDLNEPDAAEVKRLLPDVMRDGPQTNRAAVRFQTILAKIGKATYDVAIKIISDIASETAKKVLGLKP
jgi:hypothetical protein